MKSLRLLSNDVRVMLSVELATHESSHGGDIVRGSETLTIFQQPI
jgi:hypothetical protein